MTIWNYMTKYLNNKEIDITVWELNKHAVQLNNHAVQYTAKQAAQ
jgi:hypothetical protein